MKYENPQIPEGINVSSVHPLKDFALLLAGLAGVFAVVILVLHLAADHLSIYIPFSAEKKVANIVVDQYTDPLDLNKANQTVEDYLNEKVKQIAAIQGLGDEITLEVHYVPDSTINAFATIGGHLMIHKGLLQKIPNENALVMVLAHEVAHIKHRDPIRALGRGVMLTTALSFLTSASNSSSVSTIFSQAGLLTTLSFSREQEREADQEALDSLLALYGHAAGADDLFALFQQYKSMEPPEWLSSHPLTVDRIEAAKTFQRQHHSGAPTTPLPKDIVNLVNGGS